MLSQAIRGVLVGAVAGVIVIALPSPAGAACVEVDLAVHYSGGPDYYVVGPNKCVAPTPWNQTDRVWHDHRATGIPHGAPDGIFVEVWYTSP